MNVNTSRRTINKTKKPVYKPTLDVQHNAFVNTIQDMAAKRVALQEKLAEVEEEIKRVEATMREVDIADDSLVSSFTKLKDKRLDIEDELRKIDSGYNEQSYYTNTASILFDYYDLVEKGNSHTAADEPVVVAAAAPQVAPKAGPIVAKAPSILDYFKGTTVRPQTAPVHAPHVTASQSTQSTFASRMNVVTEVPTSTPVVREPVINNSSRGALLAKYMKYTDPEYTKNSSQAHIQCDDSCVHCGSSKVMIMTNDGYTWCTNCDAIEYIIIDHDKPSYRDPPKEISFFAYKRSNHLNEWISQIQGKETTEIPEEVYDKILIEIRKQKITNMAELTQKKVKSILKTLGINKYYEHSAHIVNRLTGIPMKQLSPELEEQLRSMFKMIQTPFLKHAPKNRKNFLSYSFVLHKLVQLLGHDQYLDSFSLLKSRDKLMSQDSIWRKICNDLNWEFYPSL